MPYADPRFRPFIERWSLIPDGDPISTPSSDLLPVLWKGKPAMIKLARGETEKAGAAVLGWWAGDGAAEVFEQQDHVVLLERATGSRSLRRMALAGKDEEATLVLCEVAGRLHLPRPASRPPLQPLPVWFRALQAAAELHGDPFARSWQVTTQLLAAPQEPTVLHGDLHHDNILDFAYKGWRAIDPKGLWGERTFDFANVVANPDLSSIFDRNRLRSQIELISRTAHLDARRLLRWIAAYAGLSAAWFDCDGKRDMVLIQLEVVAAALNEIDS